GGSRPPSVWARTASGRDGFHSSNGRKQPSLSRVNQVGVAEAGSGAEAAHRSHRPAHQTPPNSPVLQHTAAPAATLLHTRRTSRQRKAAEPDGFVSSNSRTFSARSKPTALSFRPGAAATPGPPPGRAVA